MPALPEFVAPMLATLVDEPFDSDQHLFEIKWDGFRALSFVAGDALRVLSRNRQDLLARHPELDVLRKVEPGAILDGELVILRDGRPDFEAMLRRDHGQGGKAAVTYVVFDLLWRRFEPCIALPLHARRAQLQEVCAALNDPRVVVSDGVVGAGRAFFTAAAERGLEGMVAKRLDSAYLPGRRTDAWRKVKCAQRLLCAILGWLPSEADPSDFKSLLVAADDGEGLRYVGRVGSGFDRAQRAELRALLHARPSQAPLVPVPERGVWVEPGLYRTVQYLERTRAGMLRAPVFVRIDLAH